MAWDTAAPPKRAGDYTRFVTRRASTLPPTTGGIVAVPFVDAWGPMREVELLTSFADYIDKFGAPVDPDNPSEGFIAVYNAFKGESSSSPGAGAVLAYRHSSSAAAKATRQLAAGATANAITIEALHEGTRGNQYRVEVVQTAGQPTQRDIKLYYQQTLLHTFGGVASTGIVQLAADINRVASKNFRATGGTNGTVLDVLAATNLAGGNDGGTLIAGDWTTTREALEPQAFGYFAAANLTDTGILASLVQWAKDLNHAQKSKRFFLVEGGAAGEDFAAAAARSLAANDENVVNLGIGTYRDTALDIELSTAQLAPRLAGIASARGGRASLSFAGLEDLEIVEGALEADILSAFDQGVVVIGRGTRGSRIERGVTTYTTTNDAEKPFDTYSRLKYVTTMQSFERGGQERNETADVIGKLPVNNDTREYLVGREQKALNELIDAKEVQPGAKVTLSAEPQDDDDEFIALDWVGKFHRSLEQVRRTVFFQ